MAKAKKEEKAKNLEELKAKMEKNYGKGTIIYGKMIKDFDVISLDSLQFDKVTDCGGIPIGKLVEIFGPESSGKSTITLEIIAKWQAAGKVCALADFEHSFDANYAKSIGVDIDNLIIINANTMEDGYNIIYEYVVSGFVDLIVIDSHTAMIPQKRLDGEIGDTKMAPEARTNSDALKKIKPQLSPNNCTIIGVSQLRTDIGAMHVSDKPTGGNAWKFYTDMRIKIYRQVNKDEELNLTTIEIIKNKCGRPFGKCQLNIRFGEGLDRLQEIIDIASEFGIIKKAGSWYSYEEMKIGQGSDAVRQLLKDNPELYEEIKQKTIEQYNKKEGVFEVPTEVRLQELSENLVNELILEDESTTVSDGSIP